MWSINKIKVAVTDPVLPVVVHDMVEISDEDSYGDVPEPTTPVNELVTVDYLVSQCRKGIAKLSKASLRDSFVFCWATDMEDMIIGAGSTRNDFIKLV